MMPIYVNAWSFSSYVNLNPEKSFNKPKTNIKHSEQIMEQSKKIEERI